MNGYLVAIVLYALVLIAIGWFIGKKVKGAGGFFVAGRQLTTGLLFTTLIAANIGAGSTVGVAGIGYKFGISGWWWIGSAGIGSMILAYVIGPKIWRISCRYNLYTLGDYLDLRYSKAFRGLISGMMAIGTLALFSGQLIGVAWILNVVANIDKVWGILIGACVTTLYFAAGGLLSAAIVNIVEVVVILLGFALATPFVISYVGGWSGLAASVTQKLGTEGTAQFFSWKGIGATTIIGYLFMLIPSFCISPGLIGKVYGAKNERAIKIGTALNGVVQLIFAFSPVIIGMCAFAAFPNLANRELALPTAMKEMMPFAVSTLALAAIFAAEVSTADAVLYMLTTSISNDIVKTFFRPNLSEQGLLKLSRKVTLICGVIGVALAIVMPNILTALQIFYSLMSVSLAAPLFLGLFCRKASSKGAILSAAGGIIITLFLQFANGGKGIWILNATSTGILFSFVIMIVSIFIFPTTKAQLDYKR
ncbi:MAG TPA: sodium:solute symporter family protein [Acetomicrobium flavidum]|uniref:sodium:solute symporter family protein n=1 Tax=Acetomicrobium flavidum TaxID=49896 RepID=UPI002BE2BAAD|nr:sodium:solute symporter family protein [Acetomicrobium flavidum]